MNDSFLRKMVRAGALFVRAAEKLQSPLLLILRLYWGWSFFMTGKGKLLNLERRWREGCAEPFCPTCEND